MTADDAGRSTRIEQEDMDTACTVALAMKVLQDLIGADHDTRPPHEPVPPGRPSPPSTRRLSDEHSERMVERLLADRRQRSMPDPLVAG